MGCLQAVRATQPQLNTTQNIIGLCLSVGLSLRTQTAVRLWGGHLLLYNGETEVLSKDRASMGPDRLLIGVCGSESRSDSPASGRKQLLFVLVYFFFWIGIFLEMTRMGSSQPVQLDEVLRAGGQR